MSKFKSLILEFYWCLGQSILLKVGKKNFENSKKVACLSKKPNLHFESEKILCIFLYTTLVLRAHIWLTLFGHFNTLIFIYNCACQKETSFCKKKENKSDTKGALSGVRQFLETKPFKNDEKCFLSYLKSSFRSQDI